MSKDGLLMGEVARLAGASRKALRLYEEARILSPPRRTASGYRVYGADTLDLLAFVRQAQRLGFSLDEIKEIVSIKRTRAPCPTSGISCVGRLKNWTSGSRISSRSETASALC